VQANDLAFGLRFGRISRLCCWHWVASFARVRQM
jgi:hypothetical protein